MRIGRVVIPWFAVSIGGAGSGSAQEFVFPSGLAIAPDGSVIMADRGAHCVFRIDPETGGTVVITGTGVDGFEGDGGPATEAAITHPFGLELDDAGNLYLWDTEAHRIRRVDRETGIITTVVGTGEQGFSGDGGPGSEATTYRPHNGRFDARGRLVFGDSFNQRIRRWDPSTGIMETIGGTGEQGSSPEGTHVSEASFSWFGAMVFAPDGDLIFSSLDNRILRIDAESGLLSVVAGTGEAGYSGDDGPASEAKIRTPYGLALGEGGDLYFSDAGNRAVRVIDGETGLIRTLSTGVRSDRRQE